MYFHPLNFIRFILALGVLLFHYGTTFYPFNVPVLKTLIENSSFRVSFFFFISGFVMTLVYGKRVEDLKASYFYKKRLTRIMPVYWLAFIITLLLVVLVKDAAPKGLIIVLHALGLQTWDPGYVLDLNFTTWSVSVELFFYALFPFLLNWFRKLSFGSLSLFVFVFYLLQSWQHYYFVNVLNDGTKRMEEFISSFPLWQLGTFICGMYSARVILLEKIPALLRKYSTWFFVLALVLFGLIIYTQNPILKYIHNGLLSPLFALTVLGLYYDESILGKTLSKPGFSRLGDLSYGIFAFQYPLWLIAGKVCPQDWQSSSYFFFGYLFVVLFVSHWVNRYFEKPILLRLRHKYHLA